MGSPTFGMLPGNNAPRPSTFAGNNPTGGFFNNDKTPGINNNFPNFSMFSPMSSPTVSPSTNAPLFSAGGMQGLSTGIDSAIQGTPQGANLYKELVRSYGKGMGDVLFKQLSGGFFNPQTASAFLNAMQPSINKGQADVLNSFGAEGSRFGSAAAYGEGTFLSQANLNEQQTLASMYMQAQQEHLSFEQGLLPTLQKENANSGGGMWSDILGGLEIAGGVAADVFTAGAATPLTVGLIGSGVGTIARGNSGGGGGNNPAPMIPGMPNPMQTGTPPFLMNYGNPNANGNYGLNNSQQSDLNFWEQFDQNNLDASGGSSLFGSTGDSSTDFAVPFN